MERRNYERHRFHQSVKISWTRTDGPVSCVGNCFEASEYGLSVEVPEHIPVGSKITVQIGKSDKGLDATVCYSRKHGYWHKIGLQCLDKVSIPK